MMANAAPHPESSREPDYWSQTRQPLTCLAFLAPLLLIYEAGVLWLGGNEPATLRNGADYWMRGWLRELGLTQALLLPWLVVGGLLAWQIVGRFPWRVSFDTLAGMLAESLLFAFALVLLGQLQSVAFSRLETDALLAIAHSAAARAVSLVGAGIYEEVLFRLCLLPACYGAFRLSRLSTRWSAVLAVLVSSLTFALAHHLGGEPFDIFAFAFRTTAGTFFAVLFVLRGFGVTVGCHAAYDLVVGVALATR